MIANGTGSETRAGAASLLERLEDPAILRALHRLLDRAEVVAFAAEAVDGVVRRGDTIADSLGESVKDFRKLASSAEPLLGLAGHLPQLAQTGEKVARLSQTEGVQNLLDSGLLEELGRPETIANLQNLLKHLELVSFAVSMLDGVLRRGEELMDNIAGLLAEARKAGGSVPEGDLAVLQETASGLLGAARQLQREGALREIPRLTDTLVHFLKSGLLDDRNIAVLTSVGDGLMSSYQRAEASRPAPLGAWGLVQAMRDPDVQRSLGFLIGFAREYGKQLQSHA
jgi:hypothetical protein